MDKPHNTMDTQPKKLSILTLQGHEQTSQHHGHPTSQVIHLNYVNGKATPQDHGHQTCYPS